MKDRSISKVKQQKSKLRNPDKSGNRLSRTLRFALYRMVHGSGRDDRGKCGDDPIRNCGMTMSVKKYRRFSNCEVKMTGQRPVWHFKVGINDYAPGTRVA